MLHNEPPLPSKSRNLITESVVLPKIIFLLVLGVFMIISAKVLKIETITAQVDDFMPYLTVKDHLLGKIVALITAFSSVLGAFFLMKRRTFAARLFIVAFFGVLFLTGYKLYVETEWDFYENLKMLAIVIFHISLVFYSLSVMEKGWFLQLQNITDSTVFLTVQKGCNNNCVYCDVPLSGPSESDTLNNIVTNAKILEEEGVKEIILKGGNIGDFGKGEHGNLTHEHTFLEMLETLDSVGGIERFRIASITTPMISEETLGFIKNSMRFAPHFDIRMHSASDAVLNEMNRPYQRTPYKELIERINKVIPNAFISVKIIVGHPGETTALFQETVDFLKDLNISFIEVFPFRKKSKTPASYMKEGVVTKDVRLKRKKILTALANEKRNQFYQSQIGSTKEVLFEAQNRNEFIYGYTENYIRVKTPWEPELLNTVHKVTLNTIGSDGIVRFDFIEEKELEVQEHFTI